MEKELSDAYGVKVKGYRSDASDFKAAEELIAGVVADFGSLDVLVNNAGNHKRQSIDEDDRRNVG